MALLGIFTGRQGAGDELAAAHATPAAPGRRLTLAEEQRRHAALMEPPRALRREPVPFLRN